MAIDDDEEGFSIGKEGDASEQPKVKSDNEENEKFIDFINHSALRRITNREKTKLGHAMRQNLIGEKMLWIQEHMLPDVTPYTSELAAELLQKYISRNDEELAQIELKHSIGGRTKRQHASREDVIRMTKSRDQTEYDTCGIEIPDIFNPAQCEMLRKWNGELRYMPNFKFVRFGKNRQLKGERDKLKNADKHSAISNNVLGESEGEKYEKVSEDTSIGEKRSGGNYEEGENVDEERTNSMDVE